MRTVKYYIEMGME